MRRIIFSAVLAIASFVCLAQNIFTNSGFEEWNPEKKRFEEWWSDSKYVSVSPDAFNGENSAFIKLKREEEEKYKSTSLSKSVPVNPGSYKLELFGKVRGDGGIFCSWSFFDAGKKKIQIKNYWTNKTIGPSADWNKIEQIIEVPENAVKMSLAVVYRLRKENNDNEGSANIDNVSFSSLDSTSDDTLQAGAKLVYQSSFTETDLAENWEIAGGKFKVENGTLHAKGPSARLFYLGKLNSPNLRAEYTAWAARPGDLSAYLCGEVNKHGACDGYFFGFGSQNNTVNRISRGNDTFAMFGGQWDSLTDSIKANEKHRVVVQRDNEKLQMFVDGKKILDGSDPMFSEMTVPNFGVYVWSEGYFSDLKIYELPYAVSGSAEKKLESVKNYFFDDMKDIKIAAGTKAKIVNIPTYVMKTPEKQRLHAEEVPLDEIGSRRVNDNALEIAGEEGFLLDLPICETESGIVEFDIFAEKFASLSFDILDSSGASLRKLEIKPDGTYYSGERKLRDSIRWMRRRYDAPFKFESDRWHTFRLRFDSDSGFGESAIMDYHTELKGAGWPEGSYGDIIIIDSAPGSKNTSNAAVLRISGSGASNILLDNLFAFGPVGFSRVNGKSIAKPSRELLDLDYPLRRDPISLKKFRFRHFPDTSGKARLGYETHAAWLYLNYKTPKDEVFRQAADEYNALLVDAAFLDERISMLDRTALYKNDKALAGLVSRLKKTHSAIENGLEKALTVYADAWWNDWDDKGLQEIYPVCAETSKLLAKSLVELDSALGKIAGKSAVAPCPAPVVYGGIKWDPIQKLWTQNGKIVIFPYSARVYPGKRTAFKALGFPLVDEWRGKVLLKGDSKIRGEYLNKTWWLYQMIDKHRENYCYSASPRDGTHYPNIFAPSWWYEDHKSDPDIIFRDADGKQLPAFYGVNGSMFLNYWNPEVRKLMQDKYEDFGKYVSEISTILYIDNGGELKNTLPGGSHPGFNDSAVKAFRDGLKKKYVDIANLNQAWGSNYASFDAITPPRGQSATPFGLQYEFNKFYHEGFAEWLSSMRTHIGKYAKLPCANDQQETFGGHVGIEPVSYLKALDIKLYHTYQGWDRKLVDRWHHQLTTVLGKRFGTLEWGSAQGIGWMFEYDKDAVSRRRELSMQTIWGASMINSSYGYGGGLNNWQYGLAFLEPTLDNSIMSYSAGSVAITHDRMRRFGELALTAKSVKPEIAMLECAASYYNNLPVRAIMTQLAEELAEASFDIEYLYDSLILEEKQSLTGTKLLWLPQAGCMTEEFAAKFYDWVKRGGVAIAVGSIPGVLNENGRPSPACPMASSDVKEEWSEAYGKGRILFFPKLPRDFLKIQSPFISKSFGSDNTNLQFRMCEKDGKTYLFVVNWDENPCESEIFVRGKYAAVIDSGLQLPVEVPTRFADGETRFKTRFAPGDMTLFQLQRNEPL